MKKNGRASAANPSFFEKIARKSTVFLVFSSFFDQKRDEIGNICLKTNVSLKFFFIFWTGKGVPRPPGSPLKRVTGHVTH